MRTTSRGAGSSAAGVDLLTGVVGARRRARRAATPLSAITSSARGRRDEHARGAGGAQRAGVAAGEVDGVEAGQQVPGQVVGGVRDEPRVEQRDRALVVVVEVGEAAARRRARADRRVQRDAARDELVAGPGAVLVVADAP